MGVVAVGCFGLQLNIVIIRIKMATKLACFMEISAFGVKLGNLKEGRA